MTPEASQVLAQDLCRIFLGWKLRDDYEALLAIGEGSLRLDLRTGEAWCDGDPLPPLFIGEELRREIEKATGASRPIERAELDAEFQTRSLWRRGEQVPALEIACRVRLRIAGREISAEANTQVSSET